ncbi:MAG TPA: MFS transporter [Polyangiaceae bacterium]|nr:MFS transporter [Polyangiaceae bacterium]
MLSGPPGGAGLPPQAGADPWAQGAPWPWLPPRQDEASAPPTAPPLPARRGWAVAAMVTLMLSISYLDRQVLSVLSPKVIAALGLTNTEYGLLGSAFSLAYLMGAPVAGFGLDRVGARRGLAVALLVWSAVSASHTLMAGFWSLLALRVALGLAEAPSFPGAVQSIHRAMPSGGARMRAVGLLYTGSSLGAVSAPLVANAFDRAFGWRFAFFGSALVGLLWLPFWLAVSGGRARRALEAPPGPRAARVTMREVWSYGAVRRAFVATFTFGPVIGFALTWLTKFLADTHGLTPRQAAPYLILPPLCFDLGAVVFGQLVGRAPRRAYTYFSVAAALAALMGALPFVSGPWAISVLCSASLAGAGGVLVINTGKLMASVPGAAVSTAGGLSASAQSLALIIAHPLIGQSIDRTGSYVPALLSVGAVALLGAGVWLSWPPPPELEARG